MVTDPQPRVPSHVVAVELLCGMVGVFGVGHFWCKRIDIGLLGMIGFWVVGLTASCVNGYVGGGDMQWLAITAVTIAVFAVPMGFSAAAAARRYNRLLDAVVASGPAVGGAGDRPPAS
jgi:hypothetical protein